MMALQTMKRIVPLLAGTFSLILGSAYPVILLALLNRRKVKDYYLGEQGS
jgi:Na+(H+)/acetate symporter ActP